ncbi:MAG: hypothetical protein HOP19_21670 [Acidobacteria bacterium]|nr:hypothetical protein [Acidobacteriota bacterium]
MAERIVHSRQRIRLTALMEINALNAEQRNFGEVALRLPHRPLIHINTAANFCSADLFERPKY